MFGRKKEKEVLAAHNAILDKLNSGTKIVGIVGSYVVGRERGAEIRITFEGGHVLSFDVKDVEFREGIGKVGGRKMGKSLDEAKKAVDDYWKIRDEMTGASITEANQPER